MKTKADFLLIVTLFLISALAVADNQPDTVKVGVVEHLDRIIPEGLRFRNEYNQPVELKNIIKHPVILSLVYFDCPGICPTLLTGVSNVANTLGMKLGKDYQIITVSFNQQDTPDRALDKKNSFLSKKTKPYGESWNYLTGDSTDIFRLTNAVGYKFIRAGNDFIHPTCIIVLSPDGKITRYLYGTSFLTFDVKMALIEAQKGISRPTINRILDYCFSYDPAGRRYSLEVTKVSATLIIFVAFLFFITLVVRSSGRRNRTN